MKQQVLHPVDTQLFQFCRNAGANTLEHLDGLVLESFFSSGMCLGGYSGCHMRLVSHILFYLLPMSLD